MVKSKNNRMSNPSKKKLPLPACDARCRPTQRDDRIVFRQRDDDPFFAFVAVEASIYLSIYLDRTSKEERERDLSKKKKKNGRKTSKKLRKKLERRRRRRRRERRTAASQGGGGRAQKKRETRKERHRASRRFSSRAPPLPREAFRARFGAETREKERERERERERESVCRLEQKNDKK